ncbi:MAG: phage tail protein [Anaerolineae bacterium]|nr:phage tail protein [Anaerolineae bacterium]
MANDPTTKSRPTGSLRFKVEFSGDVQAQLHFTEAAGMDFEMEAFEYKEGGNYTHIHRFPGRFKQGNLTLKRGITEDGSPLWQWFTGMINGEYKAANVTVSLMDVSGEVMRSWTFKDAFPIKWSASPMTAEQNAIAVETLTLAHQGLSSSTMLPGKSVTIK